MEKFPKINLFLLKAEFVIASLWWFVCIEQFSHEFNYVTETDGGVMLQCSYFMILSTETPPVCCRFLPASKKRPSKRRWQQQKTSPWSRRSEAFRMIWYGRSHKASPTDLPGSKLKRAAYHESRNCPQNLTFSSNLLISCPTWIIPNIPTFLW